MIERPILFSSEMVRAVLEGRKTQTRRVLRKQPADILPCTGMWKGVMWVALRERLPNIEDQRGDMFKCRYGEIGDRLWVRETSIPDFPKEFSYYQWSWAEVPSEYRKPEFCLYKATWKGSELKWHPSIHMPRWASRITLEITDVRVERLQDVSTEDVCKEGFVQKEFELGTGYGLPNWSRGLPAKEAFAHLWDHLNAKRGFGWDTNPWLWVIEFRKI